MSASEGRKKKRRTQNIGTFMRSKISSIANNNNHRRDLLSAYIFNIDGVLIFVCA